MALPVKTQMKYWGIVSAIFLIALWFLGDVILPFVLGGAVAYFLDPVADRFEAMGCSRALSVVIITLMALLIFVIMALLVVPTPGRTIHRAVQRGATTGPGPAGISYIALPTAAGWGFDRSQDPVIIGGNDP